MRFLFVCLYLISFSASAAFLSVSTDVMGLANEEGVSGTVSFHFDIQKEMRLELSHTMQETEKNNITMDYISTGATNLTNVTADSTANFQVTFVSLYYDFKPEEKFSPFLGLGLGVGEIGYRLENIQHTGAITFPFIEESETNMMVKLSFGMRYTFNKNFESFLQYDT
ncbi:MAG: outer membrane beta-barrel protein, partial [Alphaproteobacteria bacterium]|nr:outer membrane beta-barrel protein [Alphaproteobacteria bacterium]